MRSPVPTLVILAAALVAKAACNSDGLATSPVADLAGGGDLAAACVGLSECDCHARGDCSPIAMPCWCPAPRCDALGVCVCGGGRFLGCAPTSSHCPFAPCGIADSVTGPDAGGCLSCAPLSCAAGIANLNLNCGFNKEWLGALSCDRNPDCIVACMQTLSLAARGDVPCFDVGCSFCTTRDCSGSTPFGDCVHTCLR